MFKRKNDDDGFWDPSWDDDENFDHSQDSGWENAPAVYYQAEELPLFQDGPKISWGRVIAVIAGGFVLLALVLGYFTTSYQGGKAILETPSYRVKLKYINELTNIWNDVETQNQDAVSATKQYIDSHGNPFDLAQSLNKVQNNVAHDYQELATLKAPQDFDSLQQLILQTTQSMAQRIDAESKEVVGTTSPNIKPTISLQQSFQTQAQAIDSELTDLKDAYNISN